MTLVCFVISVMPVRRIRPSSSSIVLVLGRCRPPCRLAVQSLPTWPPPRGQAGAIPNPCLPGLRQEGRQAHSAVEDSALHIAQCRPICEHYPKFFRPTSPLAPAHEMQPQPGIGLAHFHATKSFSVAANFEPATATATAFATEVTKVTKDGKEGDAVVYGRRRRRLPARRSQVGLLP